MFSATSSSSSMPPSYSQEKLPRHHLLHNNDQPISIPLYILNYFQCLILLYFFIFTVYYHSQYDQKIENVQVTSAIYDSNSKELTLAFLFGSSSTPREIFLGFGPSDAETGRNETQVQLKPPPDFARNDQIYIYSSIEDEKPEALTVNAEHPKSMLLRDHTGHPFLELSLQEPHNEFRDVVSCFSPITGDYPMVISALISSISMKSFVSIPYEELTGELYKFLRHFEKLGNVRLTAFPLIRHKIHFDSLENWKEKELKLKRDLSNLHCWLMYKNRAKFMVFQDSEEIVLPISKTPEPPSYITEFTALFETQHTNRYASLEYNARVKIDKRIEDFSDFSMRQLLDSAVIEEKQQTPKAVVIKIHSSTTQDFSQGGKMYSFFKNFPSVAQQISPKITNAVSKIIDVAEESDSFWTLIRECADTSKSWKCSSKKCIRPSIRHRSLHGWYSYDIHFSQFLNVESYDCTGS